MTITIGLLSRKYSAYLPSFINLGLGDALWALMVYWIVAFVGNQQSLKQVFWVSLSICFLVEFSQLYQAEWINAIRSNQFGALVLGRGFLWSDLIAYVIGVGVGSLLEWFYFRK